MLESLSQKCSVNSQGRDHIQGRSPAHTPRAPGLSAELAVVLCQQDPAAVTAALFQWEWCLSQSSISHCSLIPSTLPKSNLCRERMVKS